MSCPSSRTSPSARAPGTVSCIRLRQRSNVDFPQPEGPMIAVTCPRGTPKEMSRTTRIEPKYASNDSTAIDTSRSIAAEPESRSGCEPRGNTDDEDESDEDEGTRP